MSCFVWQKELATVSRCLPNGWVSHFHLLVACKKNRSQQGKVADAADGENATDADDDGDDDDTEADVVVWEAVKIPPSPPDGVSVFIP